MELLRQWIAGVTCAAMIAAVCRALAPKSGPGRAVQFAAGLLVLVSVVRPFTGLRFDELAGILEEQQVLRSDCTEQLKMKNDELMNTVIQGEVEAYISDKAKELGIVCQAEASVETDGDGGYSVSRVFISGDLSEDERTQLSELLEGELGVLPEGQEFTQGVG